MRRMRIKRCAGYVRRLPLALLQVLSARTLGSADIPLNLRVDLLWVGLLVAAEALGLSAGVEGQDEQGGPR
jgi:hypothetical protein